MQAEEYKKVEPVLSDTAPCRTYPLMLPMFSQVEGRRESAGLLQGLALSLAIHGLVLQYGWGYGVSPGPSDSAPHRVLAVELARTEGSARGPVFSAAGAPAVPEATPEPDPAGANPSAAGTGEVEGLLHLPTSAYIPARKLTVRPRILDEVDLNTPVFDMHRVPGSLRARLLINESGVVDVVLIDSSDLPEIFSERIRAEFLKARYLPGEKDGRRVKSEVTIEVSFQPG